MIGKGNETNISPKMDSEREPKPSEVNKQQDQPNEGTKRGFARCSAEDSCAQETHISSKINHLRITYLKKKMKFGKMKSR